MQKPVFNFTQYIFWYKPKNVKKHDFRLKGPITYKTSFQTYENEV